MLEAAGGVEFHLSDKLKLNWGHKRGNKVKGA